MFEAYPDQRPRGPWERWRIIAPLVAIMIVGLILYMEYTISPNRAVSNEEIRGLRFLQPFLSSSGFEIGIWTRHRGSAETNPAAKDKSSSRSADVRPPSPSNRAADDALGKAVAAEAEVTRLRAELLVKNHEVEQQRADLARAAAELATRQRQSASSRSGSDDAEDTMPRTTQKEASLPTQEKTAEEATAAFPYTPPPAAHVATAAIPDSLYRQPPDMSDNKVRESQPAPEAREPQPPPETHASQPALETHAASEARGSQPQSPPSITVQAGGQEITVHIGEESKSASAMAAVTTATVPVQPFNSGRGEETGAEGVVLARGADDPASSSAAPQHAVKQGTPSSSFSASAPALLVAAKEALSAATSPAVETPDATTVPTAAAVVPAASSVTPSTAIVPATTLEPPHVQAPEPTDRPEGSRITVKTGGQEITVQIGESDEQKKEKKREKELSSATTPPPPLAPLAATPSSAPATLAPASIASDEVHSTGPTAFAPVVALAATPPVQLRAPEKPPAPAEVPREVSASTSQAPTEAPKPPVAEADEVKQGTSITVKAQGQSITISIGDGGAKKEPKKDEASAAPATTAAPVAVTTLAAAVATLAPMAPAEAATVAVAPPQVTAVPLASSSATASAEATLTPAGPTTTVSVSMPPSASQTEVSAGAVPLADVMAAVWTTTTISRAAESTTESTSLSPKDRYANLAMYGR